MARKAGLWILAVFAGLIVFHCAGGKKVKVDCYPCESPSGAPAVCWNVRKNTTEIVEIEQNLDISQTMLVAVVPGGTDVDYYYGDTTVEHTVQGQTGGILASDVSFDQIQTTILSNQMADGRDWRVFKATMTQADYNSWVDDLDPTDTIEDMEIVLYADWGPVRYGCDAFDEYEVELYGQADDAL